MIPHLPCTGYQPVLISRIYIICSHEYGVESTGRFFFLSFFCFGWKKWQKVNEFKVFVIIWIWILSVFFSLTIWRQFYPLPVNHLSVAIRRDYLLFYKQMVKKSWWMIVLMFAMIYARIKRMIYNSHNEFSTGTKIYIHNSVMELFSFQHVYFDIYLRLWPN